MAGSASSEDIYFENVYILKTYIYWKSTTWARGWMYWVHPKRESPPHKRAVSHFPPSSWFIASTAVKWTDHNEIYISRQLWKVWHCSLNVTRIRCSRTGTTPPENQWWDLEKEKCSILFPPFPQVDSFVYENCSHNVDTFSEFCTGKYEEVDDNAED